MKSFFGTGKWHPTRKVGDATEGDASGTVRYKNAGANSESKVKMDRVGAAKDPVEGELAQQQNSTEQTFLIDEAVEMLGFGCFQWLLSLITGLAWMADAMEMMILAVLSPALFCEWKISAAQQALITTAVFVGMLFGSLFWGRICDRYGRRLGLMFSTLLTFCMGALSALSPNYYVFLALRGLTGLGIGGVPQSVTLYSEYLPMAKRAKCVVLLEAFWAIGALFEAFLALLIMESWGWRWLLLFSSMPLLASSASCIWLPESVRFLVASGRYDEAYNTLRRVARLNNVEPPTGRLVESSIRVKASQRGKLSDLFISHLRTTTVLLWFIWGVTAFSYYGIVLFTTVLFQSNSECHGGTALAATNHTEQACRLLGQKDYLDILTTTFAEIPGLIITVCVIELLGRKRTMAVEFAVYAASIFLLLICLERHWITTIIFVARAVIAGAFQCIYVYTPEVYPTTLRAIGLGGSSMMARVGAIITPFVAQVASAVSLEVPIVIYGGAALLVVIASLMLPIETKGRQMVDSH